MPRILKKISNPQEDTMKFNQNFDNISLDMADRSGQFSSVASVSNTVTAGTTWSVEVSVIDNQSIYLINKMPVIPRFLAFVDADEVGANIWPIGNNLADATIHGLTISVFTSRTVINQATNEKATYFITVRNDDASDHTVYLYTDVYYVPAPEQGVAVRDQ